MKIAIVTDSTAYLRPEIAADPDVYVIPLSVVVDGVSYREGVDMTYSEYYRMLAAAKEPPTTSQPSVGEFLALYKKLESDYDTVISIHLSAAISGTCATAAGVARSLKSDKIHVVDSAYASVVLTLLVEETLRMTKEGRTLDDILAAVDVMKKHSGLYFFVEDLSYLVRGGRLSKVSGMLGTALQIKPVLTFRDGEIRAHEKIRTGKKAVARLVSLFDEAHSAGAPLLARVIHAEAEKEAEKLRANLAERYPDVSFLLAAITPVIGTHIGPGALGIGWTIDPSKMRF